MNFVVLGREIVQIIQIQHSSIDLQHCKIMNGFIRFPCEMQFIFIDTPSENIIITL